MNSSASSVIHDGSLLSQMGAQQYHTLLSFFEFLPNEIVGKILQYVAGSVSECTNYMLVCSRFHDIMRKSALSMSISDMNLDQTQWNRFIEVHNRFEVPQKLAFYNSNVTEDIIHKILLPNRAIVNKNTHTLALADCKRLVRRLTPSPRSDLSDETTTTTSVEAFHPNNSSRVVDDSDLQLVSLIGSMANLRCLSISKCFNVKDLGKLLYIIPRTTAEQQLTCFNLAHGNLSIRQLLLAIDSYNNNNNTGDEKKPRRFDALRILTLSSCIFYDTITSSNEEAAGQQSSPLDWDGIDMEDYMELSSRLAFDSATIRRILRARWSFPAVEYLFLGGVHFKKQDDLVALVSCFPRLQVVDLTFHSPENMAAVKELFPHLSIWNLCNLNTLPASLFDSHSSSSGSSSNNNNKSAAASADNDDDDDADTTSSNTGTSTSTSTCTSVRLSDLNAALEVAVQAQNQRCWTPLHGACYTGDEKAVEWLVAHGARIECKNSKGNTPLFLACEHNHVNIVRHLIERGGADITTIIKVKNTDMESPLYISALRGFDQVVQLLLEAAERNRVAYEEGYFYEGWSPLHAACVIGNTRVVELLLASPAHRDYVRRPNRFLQCPIHIAARAGFDKVVEMLLAAGSPLDDGDEAGATPIAIAHKHNRAAVVELLRRHGAVLNNTDTNSTSSSSVGVGGRRSRRRNRHH